MNDRADDVNFAIQRLYSTLFCSIHKTALVIAIKEFIASISDIPPQNQQLYYNGQVMDDTKPLLYYGMVPIPDDYIGEKVYHLDLTLRMRDGEFEELYLCPYELIVTKFSYGRL